jgi:hypothetical protein
MMSMSVEDWRSLLVAVSVVNVLAWTLAGVLLWWRRSDPAHVGVFTTRRTLLLLSAGYVLGCAYRSWWPVYDIPRLVVVDSWLSSIVLGRSVATVAELCFVTQCALLLRAAGHAADGAGTFARAAAYALVPMALLAETCSWYSVLSTSNLGHVFEEALWGLGAALWTAGLLSLWPACAPQGRRLLALCAVVGTAYVAYMFAHDVPMYLARWLADEAAGRTYLDLAHGFEDVMERWTVSTHWGDWHSEVRWMTLYFSVAVWLSIALVHLPLPARGRASAS